MSSSPSRDARLPQNDDEDEDEQVTRLTDANNSTESTGSSPLKRTLWMVVIGLMLLFASNSLYSNWIRPRKPQILHAQRYSKEYKFRPAASPIITESLKDGRLRVRGAGPTESPEPKPTPSAKKTKKSKGKTRRTKRKSTGKPKQGR
ncbi:hypothetical protein K435DRAFT_968628 [Dendrothele bispora CBS 962.96]|uniref:Transmembrane protein n=1 Tax=Dendrothele bispora (strain CBS 962.96) TaxID=1314807 RepID=A0A4V4HEC2_DENBC|nr:hypothetical protein K435DRAFT_968628 [Dendrothele bispora CBS 962.96]